MLAAPFQVRPLIGSPTFAFFPRSGVPLTEKSTLELLRDLTFGGFKTVTEPAKIAKLRTDPFTNARGGVVQQFT